MTGRHLRFFCASPGSWHRPRPAGDLAAALRGAVQERDRHPGLRPARLVSRLPRARRAGHDRALLVRLERHVDHRGPRSLDHGPVAGRRPSIAARSSSGSTSTRSSRSRIQAVIIGGLALLLGAQFAGGIAGLRGADAVRNARRRERRLGVRRDGADSFASASRSSASTRC